ncbi:MAG: MarR family transcriptional regulator [Nevskia sp.]
MMKSKSARTNAAPVPGPPAAQHSAALLLDNQLCFALYSTSLAMTKFYRPFLAVLELTYPQYIVLLALWERDGLTVSELGARVALDSGTLTPLLKRMQAAKLIQRTRGSDDERQVHITLAAKGKTLHAKADAVHAQVACATACSSSERQTLTRSLQRLRAALLANSAP